MHRLIIEGFSALKTKQKTNKNKTKTATTKKLTLLGRK